MYISINKEINKILYIVAFFWIVRPEYMTPIGIFNAIWNQDFLKTAIFCFVFNLLLHNAKKFTKPVGYCR